MKTIVFINRYFYPDQSATSQIVTDLLLNIDEKYKASIHVVTSRSYYDSGPTLPAFEVWMNINIHRLWSSHFGRYNLFGRAIDYITFYASAFVFLLIKLHKGDLVIAKTDPPMISVVALLAAQIKSASLINWIQDLFPEAAGKLKVINEKSMIYKILIKINNHSLRQAVLNVVIGEKMSSNLVKQGIPDQKIEVVSNWCISPDDACVAKNGNPLIDEWRLKDKFVISYSGNFGRAHEYEPIKNLINHYRDDESLAFLFVGGGKYYQQLEQYVIDERIHNVSFKPYQSRNNLTTSLSVANLHLISLKPELEGLIVPSKFYGLASIGMPILFIGDVSGEIGGILTAKNAGYVARPEELSKMIAVIENMRVNNAEVSIIRANLLQLHAHYFDRALAYAKWNSILEEY